MKSNMTVDMPLDILVYLRDSFDLSRQRRIDRDDEDFLSMRRYWGTGLRRLLDNMPSFNVNAPPRPIIGTAGLRPLAYTSPKLIASRCGSLHPGALAGVQQTGQPIRHSPQPAHHRPRRTAICLPRRAEITAPSNS